MSNDITVTVVGREAVAGKIRGKLEAVKAESARLMKREMARLAVSVKSTKLSGQVLKNHTGTLRRSVHHQVKEEGGDMSGKLASDPVACSP